MAEPSQDDRNSFVWALCEERLKGRLKIANVTFGPFNFDFGPARLAGVAAPNSGNLWLLWRI